MMRGYLWMSVAVLFLALPSLSAQALTSPAEPWLSGATNSADQKDKKNEFQSCFDYYRFGSTPTIISSDLTSVSQGSHISFAGTLLNENQYPVTDMKIYVKIFHNRNPGVKDSFGPDIVDWYLIEDDISLEAGESHPFSTVWQVPREATPGEYRVATFVVAHDRFNMAGLSFTNDIVSGNYIFHVVGGGSGNAHFDIRQTTIGGQALHAAAYSPRIPITSEGANAFVNIQNPSEGRFEGKVVWKLYAWDTALESNLIETKEEPITVGPGGNVMLQYIISDHKKTVYDLVGEIVPNKEGQSKSFVNIRFVSDAPAIPRINFAGTTGYPGEVATEVFACIHSTGTKEADNVRLELVATSNSILDFFMGKRILATEKFEGTAPGSVVAFAAPLVRASDSYTVRAKLYQNEVLIDDVSVPFECAAFSESCLPSTMSNALLGVAVILIIGGALYILRRKKII